MDKWVGLKAIGLVRKTINNKNGEVAIEERYFICSIFNIDLFVRAVRDHRDVEIGSHWHLDYKFNDDKKGAMNIFNL